MRPQETVTLAWIIAITVVAVYGPAWVAFGMLLVAVGGPPAARALANRFKLPQTGDSE